MTTEEELAYLRERVSSLHKQVDTLKIQVDTLQKQLGSFNTASTDWVTTFGKPGWDRISAPVRYRINAKTDGVQYWQQHEFVYADGGVFKEEWIPSRKSFVGHLFSIKENPFQELYQQQIPINCE